jgi:hypothetical protein
MTAAWSAPTTAEEAYRRAGARRALNYRRQTAAFYRRMDIYKALFKDGKFFEKGIRIRLATQLGISYRQVCRDIKTLLSELNPCPHCGAPARLREKC